MTPNGVMSTYLPWRVSLEGSGLLRTAYAFNSVHYTHWKLIVHILIETSASMRRKFNVVQ